MDLSIPCFWCGSRDTRFKHIENWEEDERGNAICTSQPHEKYSPRLEVWYCENCQGDFAFPFEVSE